MRLNYYQKIKENFKLVFACVFFVLLTATGYNQVSVSATAGVLGPTAYTNLSSAFTAINAGTHQGAITIDISASFTDVASSVLNSSGAGSASYTSVLIRPSADGVTMSYATPTGRGVIELKGADNVTIDGDNPGTGGINRNLTITNTAVNTTTYTSVVRIATAATVVTSADNNTIKNCNLNGSATGRNTSLATSTTGSENTVFGIYVGGNGGATAIDAPTAITSVTSNTAVSGTTVNSLLVNNNAINSAARAIVFNGAATTVSTGVTVSNNLIGDQAAVLTGIPPYISPATTVYTKAVWLAGTSAVSVTGNTIKNILSYVATTMSGIELASAIGTSVTITGNTITGMAQNGTSSAPNGILVSSTSGTFTIGSNTITNIHGLGSAASIGISVSYAGTSGTIELNKIDSVIARNGATYGAYGINITSGNNVTLRNNFVGKAYNSQAAGTGASMASSFGVYGIRLAGGTGHKVYHNTVHLTGTIPGATNTDFSIALAVLSTSQTGIDIRNNILSNQINGGNTTGNNCRHVCIYLPSSGTSAMNLTLNNNTYYQGTSIISTMGQAGTTIGTNEYLAANFIPGATAPATNWRAYSSTLSVATTNDNASYGSTNTPPVISATDLHINLASGELVNIEQKGATGTGVASDIDGDVRPNTGTTIPDIGGDEVASAVCAGVPAGGTISPASASACATTTYLMSTTGSGAGTGITYQWEISATGGGLGFSDVTGGSGATTTSYTTGSLVAGTYYYRLRVTCATGPDISYSNELTLTVNPAPTPGTASGPLTGVTYTNYNYTLAGYAPGSTFQWQSAVVIGGPYTDIPSATLDNTTLYSAAGGTFYIRCKVTNGGCSDYSNILTVVISVAGDNVCSAIPIATGLNGPFTNIGATTQVGEPQAPNTSCSGQTSWCTGTSGLISNSVWFSFTAPASGRISVHFSPNNWDSQIALWSAADCSALLSGGQTMVAANDDSASSPFNAWIAPICVTPGQTYWLQVDGYGTTTNGAFSLILSSETNAAPIISGCPGDVTVMADAYSCTQTATWIAPTANDADNCVSPLSFTSTYSPGASFPIGTTLVTYTASDGVNTPVTCSFNVTVNVNPASIWYYDSDGDGYGNPGSSTIACSAPSGYVLDNTDCHDGSASVNPGATEVCNFFDDDCDGTADEGITYLTYYNDADGDGYGAGAGGSYCSDPGAGFSATNDDCNDLAFGVNPGASEVCGNGIDDNCNGSTDEGCTLYTYYYDGDGDGFGDAGISTTSYSPTPPSGYVADNTDCNDGNASINPGATEICNFIDEDCDGVVDDGITYLTYYNDADGDGYGAGAGGSYCTDPGAGFSATNDDCNDLAFGINPGATEVCNFIDDDCDGSVDDGITYLTYYNDADGDGYGAGAGGSYCTDPGAGFSATNDDCNDLAFGINPGATEVCNAIDDDCDGSTDEGLVFSTWYADTDADTYGDAFNTTSTCDGPPAGYVGDATDCDDTQATVYPGAAEICDGLDNDCDGDFDEGTVTATVSPSGFVTTCKGDPIVLSANGGIGYTYQWFKNGNIILGATNQTYGATKSGNYSVQVTIPAGCFATSANTAVLANPKPNATINAPNGTSLCATVKLKVTQNAAYSYQWYKDGLPIGGATAYLYTATLPGSYYCVVTATATGCFRNSATLVVTACKEGTDLSESGMEIYPNPTDQSFTVDLVIGSVEKGDATIQIFNMVGEEVYNANASVINNKLSEHIELAQSIPGGVYFVKVVVGTAEFTKQLILQK